MIPLQFLCVFSIIVALKESQASPTNLTNEISVNIKELTGEKLVNISLAVNNTLLKMIGHLLVNLEESLQTKLCQMNPCTDWTIWTRCSATGLESFGFQTRMRTCWYKSSRPCAKDGGDIVENESRVCESNCGNGYNVSKNGYCLKAYSTKMSQPEAEKQCQQDNGHLMNIDTDLRWTDHVEIAKQMSLADIWIDGTRSVAGGSWTYLTGSDPSKNDVNQWISGEPSNRSNELCKVSDKSGVSRYWYDRNCSDEYPFICEIRSN